MIRSLVAAVHCMPNDGSLLLEQLLIAADVSDTINVAGYKILVFYLPQAFGITAADAMADLRSGALVAQAPIPAQMLGVLTTLEEMRAIISISGPELAKWLGSNTSAAKKARRHTKLYIARKLAERARNAIN